MQKVTQQAVTDKEYEQNILELYKLLGSAKKVADQINISMLDVYAILKKHKLSIEDRMQCAENGYRLGAIAEAEFAKLVPFAMEVNAIIYNNPAFDFLIGDITVDVKASRILSIKRRGQPEKTQWKFLLQRPWQTEYGADFYMLFALHGQELQEGYDTYIIPSELLDGKKQVSINSVGKEKSVWQDFRIANDKVCEFFKKIADTQTRRGAA